MPTKKTKTNFNVAVVGATGIVGREFIKILQERNFPVGELRLFATERSAGESFVFKGQKLTVRTPEKGCFKGCDIAFFSAGSQASKEIAPQAVNEGVCVVDNSSAFRMDPAVPLVVPEVNPDAIPKDGKPIIIANPNCSTIQLVVALKPLHDSFGVKSVTVATYQSVSGAGAGGIDELKDQTSRFLGGKKSETPKVFAQDIAFNNLPHIDVFDESGFTYEEKKMMNETRKIMNLPKLPVSVTCVRTPTLNAHSEAVWIELSKDVTKNQIIECLNKADGIVVQDNPKDGLYPTNRHADGRNEVFVGRIRQDPDNPRRWLFWIVSDNVRKGAALNGIQIAEILISGDALLP